MKELLEKAIEKEMTLLGNMTGDFDKKHLQAQTIAILIRAHIDLHYAFKPAPVPVGLTMTHGNHILEETGAVK